MAGHKRNFGGSNDIRSGRNEFGNVHFGGSNDIRSGRNEFGNVHFGGSNDIQSGRNEFNNVFFVLGLIDEVADNPNLINRELVYTAITRAKKNITIFSDQKTWDIATSRSSNRMSGMLEHLIDLNNQERPRENNDI